MLDHETECLVTHTKLNSTILVYMTLNGKGLLGCSLLHSYFILSLNRLIQYSWLFLNFFVVVRLKTIDLEKRGGGGGGGRKKKGNGITVVDHYTHQYCTILK